MNRREIIAAAAVVPLVRHRDGDRVYGDPSYIVGSPQCGVCKQVMPAEFINERPLTWCVNSRCERYEIKYVLPMTTLERA